MCVIFSVLFKSSICVTHHASCYFKISPCLVGSRMLRAPPFAKTLLGFLNLGSKRMPFGEAFLLYLVLTILMIELDPKCLRIFDVCFHL